jgi:hypothetical protein
VREVTRRARVALVREVTRRAREALVREVTRRARVALVREVTRRERELRGLKQSLRICRTKLLKTDEATEERRSLRD